MKYLTLLLIPLLPGTAAGAAPEPEDPAFTGARFTVECAREYIVRNLVTGAEKTLTGKELPEGLPVTLAAGEEGVILVTAGTPATQPDPASQAREDPAQ